jgi:hypothetical protein
MKKKNEKLENPVKKEDKKEVEKDKNDRKKN